MRDSGHPDDVAAYYDNRVLTSVATAHLDTIGTKTVHTDRGRLALVGDGVGKALQPTTLHEVLREFTDPREAARMLRDVGPFDCEPTRSTR
ncbi:hypothetical protein ALI22I_01625 [Saccharothrix sp. ALI-22-I]|uniref:hypothetical protein n=1 Tax=Saccharothrix sp. ALI-22-I TaxID=1933778 RepID=UPI00097C2E1E|nr:hypothetical protein [Saccharothrix sp. ALI-22-I]ONI92845.1 hypothetical protein ALI22I_01625 [Saccharothrix sp. ALI-22-I]